MADMTQTPPVVEPTNPQAVPQVEPQNPIPPEETGAVELPEELTKIPAIQAVLVGTPPAVSVNLKNAENRDEIQLMAKNKGALESAGMGFYKSLSGRLGVMFNGLRINPEDIKAADQAGKLEQIAPDFDKVNLETAKSVKNHPILNANLPSGVPPPASASAPQAASGKLPLVPPAPAAVARKLAAQRIISLQAGAPTSGPSPGAGRLLNQVLKPVV